MMRVHDARRLGVFVGYEKGHRGQKIHCLHGTLVSLHVENIVAVGARRTPSLIRYRLFARSLQHRTPAFADWSLFSCSTERVRKIEKEFLKHAASWLWTQAG